MSCTYYNQGELGVDQDTGEENAAGYYNELGWPCTPSNGGGNSGGGNNNPWWSISQGGAQGGGGTYSTTLQAILSGLAILHNQPYVPTTVQPAQQPIVYASPNGQYGGNGVSHSNNTLGSLQNFLTKNSGALLLVGAVIVVFEITKKGISR